MHADLPVVISLLAARSGRCFIHKAKRNSNMTFSKGKTWNLEDVRLIEVQDVSSSCPVGPAQRALTSSCSLLALFSHCTLR